MLNNKICNLREKLNKSIEENESYETIYELSVELDKLIEEYYRIDTIKTKVKTKKENKLLMK